MIEDTTIEIPAAAQSTFEKLVPIASRQKLGTNWKNNSGAVLEAAVLFRGRMAPFDFSLRNSTDQGPERQDGFIDSAARVTEHFATDVGETPPDYSGLSGMEKAFAVRQHMIQRLQALGPLIIPTPQTTRKPNGNVFYDESAIRDAANTMRTRIEEIVPLEALWLYGSGTQTKKIPGDLDFKAIVKEPLTFDQYQELMRIRMQTLLKGDTNRPAAFSVLDIPTWKAIYPLEETFWPQEKSHEFLGNNTIFTHPETEHLSVKLKLMQDLIALYRMAEKLEAGGDKRSELLELAQSIPDIPKARIRNVNVVIGCLKTLGVDPKVLPDNFMPPGTVEQKLEACRVTLYLLAALVPSDL